MDLNIKQMKELIDLFESSNLSEISVQQDEFQVTLKKNSVGRSKLPSGEMPSRNTTNTNLKNGEESTGADQQQVIEDKSDEKESAGTKPKGQNAIISPIVGTFYRSPSPEEPPYVEVGDDVKEGDTVCIVEAMKVMNEVKAQQDGKITEICVVDGDSVEYGQELFKLSRPNKGN